LTLIVNAGIDTQIPKKDYALKSLG